MKRYGLIGKRLEHSWSKQYFTDKFDAAGLDDCRYQLYAAGDEVQQPAQLQTWLDEVIRDEHLLGFNVTLPYKQWVMPLLQQADPTALATGAVNCVRVQWQQDGSYLLEGHNTDAPAFRDSLLPLLQSWHHAALVLGTGGAARAVAYALHRQNIAVTFVSRHPGQHHDCCTAPGDAVCSYSDAYALAEHTYLIVNATPVGMAALEAETPFADIHHISFRHLCYDLIYNPEETRFLLECELTGATIKNGLEMLHRQADLSWHCFALPSPQ